MTAATFVSVAFTPGPEIHAKARVHDTDDPRRSGTVLHIEIGDLRLMLDDVEAEQLAAVITRALKPGAPVNPDNPV